MLLAGWPGVQPRAGGLARTHATAGIRSGSDGVATHWATTPTQPLWQPGRLVTRPTRAGHQRTQRGSATVELVMVTPILVMLLLFMVLAGRVVVAMGDLEAATRDAARAASLSRSAAAARHAAEQAATADLAQTRHLTCQTLQIQADTTRFQPRQTADGAAAGMVSVTIRCQLNLSDLSPLHLGGTRLVQRRATSPVDAFRGVSLGLVTGGAGDRGGGARW